MANGNRKKKGERQGSVLAKKKYDMVTELYMEAAKEVSAKPENWMAFLSSACRNYRLPFDEQLLIPCAAAKRSRSIADGGLEQEIWALGKTGCKRDCSYRPKIKCHAVEILF